MVEQKRVDDFQFTADHIGSEILERFSQDIYSPKAIIRELVKNGFDSYLQLEKHYAENGVKIEELEPSVDVNIVDGNSILIADRGIGLDRDDFDGLISIALTEKRDIDGVTGFRGIGFWSAFAGGDQIVIESTKVGSNKSFKLTLNTRLMRQLQGPNVSVSKIMNNPKCMELRVGAAQADDHYTKVLIIAEREDARLKPLLSDDEQMRQLLREGCACRWIPTSKHRDILEGFYSRIGIRPLVLTFNGQEILKEMPGNVGDVNPFEFAIKEGKRTELLAKGWFCTNIDNARLGSLLEGIRLHRDGFPIGKANLYSGRTELGSSIEITREDLLQWHIGEVHLIFRDLRPSASGEEIRDTKSLPLFTEELRAQYVKLIELAYEKQRGKSLKKEYQKFLDEVAQIQSKGQKSISEEDDKALRQISATIERDKDISKGPLKAEAKGSSRESLVRDPAIKKLRADITKHLLALGINRPAKVKRRRTLPASNGAAPAVMPGGTPGPKDNSNSLAVIDEIRDIVADVLINEPSLRDELLKKLNALIGRRLQPVE